MKIIPLENTPATLTPYLLDSPADGVVIVCPGGGYTGLAEHEAEPIAKAYNQQGYHAYVLRYRVREEKPLGTQPLYDACTAIAYVRAQADTLGISPDTIAICGFSAGGHLAASTGVYWNQPDFFGGTLTPEAYRPNATILCYPVISDLYPHVGSFKNLLGEDAEDFSVFSLDKQVTDQTAPAFLWHTAADEGVPVGNALVYTQRLAEHGLPVELHVFPYGAHGLGLATLESGAAVEDPHVTRWLAMSAAWLSLLFTN